MQRLAEYFAPPSKTNKKKYSNIATRVKGLEGRDIAHAGVAPNSDLEEGQQVQFL
jgi:hypothetical protein